MEEEIIAYLCVDKDGTEVMIQNSIDLNGVPCRQGDNWRPYYLDDPCIILPKGSIKKLIGKELSWEDGFYEYK